MGRLTLGRVLLLLLVPVGMVGMAGCASVVDVDFDAAIPTPTQCSLVEPQSASLRSFKRCDSASTCAFDDDGTGTACVALIGAKQPGEACEFVNECAPGLGCMSAIGCVNYCEVGATCADGAACIAFEGGTLANGRAYGFCPPPSCDPLSATEPSGSFAACDTGQCRFISEGRTACFFSESHPKPAGYHCEDDLGCAPSDTCFRNTCRRLCRVGVDACPSGRECVPGASDVGEPTLDGQAYGHCT